MVILCIVRKPGSKLNEKHSDSSHKTESKENYNNGPETEDEEQFASLFTNGDRFYDQGEEMIKDAALTGLHLLRSLPASDTENFAVALRDTVAELIVKQQVQTARQKLAPLELPNPLPKPNVRAFPSSRKRAMTGREAAEQAEIDAVLARRRQQRKAQAAADKS